MATKYKSRYMKTGNIADNRVGLAPNPEEKPKVVKKSLKKKTNANATPKKPSPKAPAKKATSSAKPAPKKNASPKPKTNKSKPSPKYRFNSPASLALTPQNFEDLFILEGKGESREEFKRKM